MPKQRKKSDLPTRTCATCGLPFTWRKKWEKVWDEVRYCSDRCRSEKKKAGLASLETDRPGTLPPGSRT